MRVLTVHGACFDFVLHMHTYRLPGVSANYGYRFKSTATDTCIGGVDVPGALAPTICQTGISDGYFSGTLGGSPSIHGLMHSERKDRLAR